MIVYKKLPQFHNKTFLTIGTYDGIHKGHIEILKARSRRRKCVITFRMHPDHWLKRTAPGQLTSLCEKISIFREKGVSYLVLLDFEKIKDITAYCFLRSICKRLKPAVIRVGYNFRFGKNNTGNVDLLREQQNDLGYRLQTVRPVKDRRTGAVVSSSAIRQFIAKGRIKDANRMLGRNYAVEGTVVRGTGLGRRIGFPTINLRAKPELVLPENGVFKTSAVFKNKRYRAMTCIGIRPTVSSEGKRSFETNVFGFNKKIYGKKIRIEFIAKIRENRRFKNIASLKKQLKKDRLIAAS